jgi:hypothetical protein
MITDGGFDNELPRSSSGAQRRISRLDVASEVEILRFAQDDGSASDDEIEQTFPMAELQL